MTPNYKITEEILNLVQKISELATQLSFETRGGWHNSKKSKKSLNYLLKTV